MSYLSAALWSEILKVRRSKVFPATIGFFAFVAMMMGLLMIVAKHPELAGRSATLSAKASFLKNGDWSGFMTLILQTILALGPIGYGIVTSWVFGREYADHTVKDLLALPVSRSSIVAAKFIVVVIWSVLISAVFFAVALLTAWMVNVPGWSFALFQNGLSAFLTSVLLTIVLCTPVAFVASMSRGYLLAIGYVILVLIMTQLVGMALPGIVAYFPWIVPALCSGMAGSSLPQPEFVSYVLLAVTGILGFAGTVAWWELADQT